MLRLSRTRGCGVKCDSETSADCIIKYILTFLWKQLQQPVASCPRVLTENRTENFKINDTVKSELKL